MSSNKVAVVAHNKKTLGGGLDELRRVLATQGVEDPVWFEIAKSKKAPAAVKEALRSNPGVLMVWGGDGTVQRCIDTMVGSSVPLAIVPAGTANLLATNLGIPKDIEQAVEIALHGEDNRIDAGRINGEHFAVMAGTGLDAFMIRDADRGLKDKLGRAAYVWSGARNVRRDPIPTTINVDGHEWFKGDAGCVLVGNVGEISGGITAFDHASPTDGRLDLAVITASSAIQWARALTRAAMGTTEKSPLVQMTTAKKIDVRTKTSLPYELDGGCRGKTDHLKIKVIRSAVTIRVPAAT